DSVSARAFGGGIRRVADQRIVRLGTGWVSVLVTLSSCADVVEPSEPEQHSVRPFQRSVERSRRRDAPDLCILGIPVNESIWPELLHGVSFAATKANATKMASGATHDPWKDTANFFHKGTDK